MQEESSNEAFLEECNKSKVLPSSETKALITTALTGGMGSLQAKQKNNKHI